MNGWRIAPFDKLRVNGKKGSEAETHFVNYRLWSTIKLSLSTVYLDGS
jgi:hypothetical protein